MLEFFIIFQIYVPYILKIQTCNIYKYRTYDRNLRVTKVNQIKINIFNISALINFKFSTNFFWHKKTCKKLTKDNGICSTLDAVLWKN